MEDMKKVINHLNGFSVFSDLFLNLNKSYALSTNGMSVDTGGLNIEFKKQVKILGLHFSHEKEASLIEDNWINRIRNIKGLLNTWGRRNMSLVGKIHVLKTFGLSQLVFLMQSIFLPESVLREVNQIFFHFLWKNKGNKKTVDKVKREVLYNTVDQGGLKMINIFKFQKSALLQWGASLLNNETNPRKQYTIQFFKQMGGKSVFANKARHIVKNAAVNNIPSIFWKKVLDTWLKHSDNDKNNPTCLDPIFNNVQLTYKKKTIFLPTCIARGINSISDMLRDQRIITLAEFQAKTGRYARSILDYIVIYNAIFHVMNKIQLIYAIFHVMNKIQLIYTEQYLFKGIPVDKIDRKKIYDLLIAKDTSLPACIETWRSKFGIILSKQHWSIINQFKESRLKTLWWKILHNVYPTGSKLLKMKLSNTDRCTACHGGQVDNIEHFFVNCPKIKQLWIEVSTDVLTLTNKTIKLSDRNIILGVIDRNRFSKIHCDTINHLIAVGKLTISKFKYGPKRNLLEIYETEKLLRKL